jgi:putative flippase GtrA
MKNEINVGHYRVSVDTTGNEDNMIEKIKALWIKYEEIIAYLIVGGLTTVVSWAAKFLANFLLFDNTMYPTPFQNIVLSIINWTAGVIFAYFTNRKFVFKSNASMLSEAPKFVLSRVSTLILDMVVMQVLTAVGVNLLVATVISAVLVIIGNYVFSKLFVFNKKKDGEAEEAK